MSTPTPAPSLGRYDDLYEDTGDLDMTHATQDVWLSRVPRPLWENWAHLDEDEEIQVGTVRIEGTPRDIKRVSLRLTDGPRASDVPRDYTLCRQQREQPDNSHQQQMLQQRDQQQYRQEEQQRHAAGQPPPPPPPASVQNTFVFTEKDPPGYVDRGAIMFGGGGGQGRSYLYEQAKRETASRARRGRWEPYARRTIPKQTALVGRVSDEFNCLPIENEEYRRLAEQKALELLKPKKQTIFRKKITGDMRMPQGLGDRSTFIQVTNPKPRATTDNKAARMPQNELLDALYACFRRYRYWPFKSLKNELRQPEAYLKQTLEMVAHLVRSGNFAMTWTLNDDALESGHGGELAPAMDEE